MKAKRTPSYFRVAASSRSGRIEMPFEPGPGDEEAPPPRDPLRSAIERWKAPVLSEEEIEIYGQIFLMTPSHELMPFFLWVDAVRASMRHS
jgi:hypothetical protein